jgi:uncharacterized membrane protein
MKLLLAGESWTTHSIHVKGFDTFTTSEYVEGAGVFIDGLRGVGHELDYLPAHQVPADFPATVEALSAYDAVILSDIGSNSFLLAPQTFGRSEPSPNRLRALADYVAGGGGLLMIGGYMSFSGVDCVARYGRTALAPALPVEMFDRDDRVEEPAGIAPSVLLADHPALADVPAGDWPALLGYNQVAPAAGAETLVTVGGDPLLVIGSHGSGRSAAFTSDLAPHWAPPAFMEWAGYMPLWTGILSWLGRVADE